MPKYSESVRKVFQEKHETIVAGLVEIENMSKEHADKVHALQREINKEMIALQGQLLEMKEEYSVIEKRYDVLRFRIGEVTSTTLHKLCHSGNMERIKAYVDHLDDVVLLGKMLGSRKGVFGYTPLHEAVASGKPEVLQYLLKSTGNSNVNCPANSGITPLHLAVSNGHGRCVQELLAHGADISCADDYGNTPKQAAELRSKHDIVKILQKEGELQL